MTLHNIARFYTSFNGRATRADFNIRYLCVVLIGSIVAGGLDYMAADGDIMALANGGFASTLWNFMIIIPTFAITTRRLHDINLSGWWQAVAHLGCAAAVAWPIMRYGMMLQGISQAESLAVIFIVTVYLVFWVALSCVNGTKGTNKYGEDPLKGSEGKKHDGK